MSNQNIARMKVVGATLLTEEEFTQLPAHLHLYDHWWWLRSKGLDSRCAKCVYDSGKVGEHVVSLVHLTIRPVLTVENAAAAGYGVGDAFLFGGKRFEMISEDRAFCCENIGTTVFREDPFLSDSNDYEASLVKLIVDHWFESFREH